MLSPHQQRLFQDALALHQAGKLDEAERIYRDLLAVAPNHADILQLLGVVNLQRGRPAEAIVLMEKSLALVPDQPRVHLNLGSALSALGQEDKALASFARALALQPDFADAYYNQANVLHKTGRWEQSLADFQRAIHLKPDFADAFLNQGNVLKDLRRFNEAEASYRQALRCNPRNAKACNNLGLVSEELGHPHDAMTHYLQAIEINSSSSDAFVNLGNLYRKQRRYREALETYRAALQRNPNLDFIPGYYIHCKQLTCDWTDLDAATAKVLDQVSRGIVAAVPLTLMATAASPALLRKSAELNANRKSSRPIPGIVKANRSPDGKLRIGYFSSDFHDHAVGHLIVEMLERHDRTKFEIVGFSWSAVKDSDFRSRLTAAFDTFIDVHTESDADVTLRARTRGIDIAIDLLGLTNNERSGIFAGRCAPVQVNYLGYPGTMGAPYMDYLIADAVIIPAAQRPHYSERIVYLPDAYQPNDSKRKVAPEIPSRQSLGLPETGFVFCSFNANFKVTPAVFDIWMRLLHAVPGSVLWLLGGSPEGEDNLRREARARAVSPDRLVFAPRAPLDVHLARHAHADLFLDTFYYNGHTTTSDALWMGVPVVTWAGETFAGRVAASLLCAAELPELVTTTWAGYEALALTLATDADRRLALRAGLIAGRSTSALFDTVRFTRNIEAAYTRMWERVRDGLPPADVVIEPLKNYL